MEIFGAAEVVMNCNRKKQTPYFPQQLQKNHIIWEGWSAAQLCGMVKVEKSPKSQMWVNPIRVKRLNCTKETFCVRTSRGDESQKTGHMCATSICQVR